MSSFLFAIEAIVCDPRPSGAMFGGDYFKLVFSSYNASVEHHVEYLSGLGYRVLSVKSRPVADDDDIIEPDRQGNLRVVGNKVVRVEDDDDVGTPTL